MTKPNTWDDERGLQLALQTLPNGQYANLDLGPSTTDLILGRAKQFSKFLARHAREKQYDEDSLKSSGSTEPSVEVGGISMPQSHYYAAKGLDPWTGLPLPEPTEAVASDLIEQRDELQHEEEMLLKGGTTASGNAGPENFLLNEAEREVSRQNDGSFGEGQGLFQ
jgi:hypothetical protein